jgi:hypothetical protein
VSRALLTSLLVAVVLAPAAARAAEPPNQNDPCSRGGRDSCHTTGLGSYETYRYGVRWFGDYRGAVPSVKGPTFCLDLRFWYPSSAFRYARLASADGLENRAGETVAAADLAKMSYAIWRFGDSGRRSGQQAVMLYVHQLMGDGAPGEVNPAALGPVVQSAYRRVARDAARYAGPYRLETSLPSGSSALPVRRKTTLTARVVAASGAAVPDVKLELQIAGAGAVPQSVRTGADGVARIPITPTDAKGGVRGAIRSQLVAAPSPAIYAPRRADAARNGQRLAGPATTRATADVAYAVAPAQIAVTTTATPATLTVGDASRDAVSISGAFGGWRADVDVRLYGPARTRDAIDCTGAPAAETTYTTGAGASMTPVLRPALTGWYAYQLVIPDSDDVLGLTTACGEASELLKVEAQPTVRTQISTSVADAGAAVTDTALVAGLGGETVTVNASLYGPYGAPDKITCAQPPVWTGSFEASADGSYVTAPFTLTVPGYYTYRESIAASEFVRPVETPCAETAETTIVRGRPQITTQVSAQETAPGASITDSVVVGGLGALSAPVKVELWGPFETTEAIRCDGTPLATSTLTATGDATYTSAPTTLDRAGYYTYRESIDATAAYAGAATPCGEVSETTFARATPAVTTVASSQGVRPGARIFDRIRVTGLGKTPAQVEVRLFGPFASRAAMTCGGTPLWKGTVPVSGDGEFRSPQVRVPRAGFYTYRERIVGTPTVAGVETGCGEEAETSLARPLILTGRGDPVTLAAPATLAAAAAAPSAASDPVHVRLARLGIDADVYGADIDTRLGVLDVPQDIDRVGWWRDGAAPGASTGTILLAGHVDSAKRGAGAFYALKGARRGDTVTVRSDGGTTRSYRVTSMRRVRKAALPAGIFTRGGERRLVLVTCGGPFDAARGRYRDNVIVTAVPR